MPKTDLLCFTNQLALIYSSVRGMISLFSSVNLVFDGKLALSKCMKQLESKITWRQSNQLLISFRPFLLKILADGHSIALRGRPPSNTHFQSLKLIEVKIIFLKT